MIIGKFYLANGGEYNGVIEVLGTDSCAVFKPQDRGADYLVTAAENACEFGAAWKRTSRDRKQYLSVKLDSPLLPEPVNCALLQQEDGSYALVWNRSRRQAEPKPE
jgi:uncharacterized protein (DUF736 family)